MRLPNEKKRSNIVAAAAKMFASHPYHEVRLDELAAAAGVGKGTLYVYFKSKEDLYFSLVEEGFTALVDRLQTQLEPPSPPAMQAIRIIVEQLVRFAIQHPDLFELMRSTGGPPQGGRMEAKHKQLTAIIEKTIRLGVRRGELHDPNPQITALCIPGLVRSVFLFGPQGLNEKKVTAQLVGLLNSGIAGKAAGKATS